MNRHYKLYCDGGVIGPNPSPLGGTYAIRIIHVLNMNQIDPTPAPTEDIVIYEQAGVITPSDIQTTVITNNHSEMFALLKGLERLPPDVTATVFSDSLITLGRIFMGWRWNNIPQCMHTDFQTQIARLANWEKFKFVHLDGHPTKAQLIAGFGKRGNPVSEHNVWCDEACTLSSQDFKREYYGTF